MIVAVKAPNQCRAYAACYALKVYEEEKNRGARAALSIKNPLFMRELMVDLVTDLHHLAGQSGIDWESVIRISSDHFQSEGGVQ
jgi:hypothetical protein